MNNSPRPIPNDPLREALHRALPVRPVPQGLEQRIRQQICRRQARKRMLRIVFELIGCCVSFVVGSSLLLFCGGMGWLGQSIETSLFWVVIVLFFAVTASFDQMKRILARL